jgi:hypothetical protein
MPRPSVLGDDVLAAVRAMVDRGSEDAKTCQEWGEVWRLRTRPTLQVLRKAIAAGLMEVCTVPRPNIIGVDRPCPAYRIVPRKARKR